MHSLTTQTPQTPHQPRNVPCQLCSQHQGMQVAALPPPLARLAALRHSAAAAYQTAQEEAESDVSMPHRQAGRQAGTLLLPSILVVEYEYVHTDETQDI